MTDPAQLAERIENWMLGPADAPIEPMLADLAELVRRAEASRELAARLVEAEAPVVAAWRDEIMRLGQRVASAEARLAEAEKVVGPMTDPAQLAERVSYWLNAAERHGAHTSQVQIGRAALAELVRQAEEGKELADAFAFERDEWKATADKLAEALDDACNVATWMSGSPSFGSEGDAHEGWIEARDRLYAALAALAEYREREA